MKLAALFTGGKDSIYAIYLAKKMGHEIVCLITMKSENLASYMFHTPAIELTALQAEAMSLPIIFGQTKGEKEKELVDLENTIRKAGKKYEFEGLITGALFSEYQTARINNIAQKLKLQVISPLWHKPQEKLMRELLENKFKFIFTAVAAYGLDKSWLNIIIGSPELNRLNELNKQVKINIAGEGGETESLVLDCPLFKKKIVIKTAEIIEDNKNTARLKIKEAVFMEKFKGKNDEKNNEELKKIKKKIA